MRLFRHQKDIPEEFRGGAIALGNFDGVHKGHQSMIAQAGRLAKELNAPWGVMTFEPHAREVFSPNIEPFRLTPFHTKVNYLEATGVDFLLVLKFDKEFASQTAENFVKNILMKDLGVKGVVCGYDFEFGKGRHGNAELLQDMGEKLGFDVRVVEAVLDEHGEPYSSTRVRKFLKAANPEGARHLMGRPFEIVGRVVEGERLGRTIGFPTVNVPLGNYIEPAHGVYAVYVGVEGGNGVDWRKGVANLGRRPTVQAAGVTLEAHIFDTDEDLYDRHVRIAFMTYLRGEQKFNGLDDLKQQIEKDCKAARAALSGPMPKDLM